MQLRTQVEAKDQLPSIFTGESLSGLAKRSALGPSYDALRRSAWESLRSLPLPTAKDELWRQTKLEQFDLGLLPSSAGMSFELKPYFDSGGLQIYKQAALETGNLPDSLLKEVLLELGADLEHEPVSLLQRCATSAGCVLRVKKNADLTKVLCLSQLVQAGAKAAAPFMVVELGPGSRLVLIEDLNFSSGFFYFPRLEFVLRENAALDFVSLQRMSREGAYLGRQRFHIGRDSFLRCLHVFLGAGLSRLDLDCRLCAPGGSAELLSVYLAQGSQHVDFHPVQSHLAPHCSSNLLCKGVLNGAARGVYYGVIRVAEQAQKTDAYQKNRNLLLSEEARVDAIPNLEIRANDVKCSHGATVGQVGADEMFYLMTRGLNAAQAERLLVEGFFEDCTARIKDSQMQGFVSGLLLEYLRNGTAGMQR